MQSYVTPMATFPHFLCANLICALLPALGCTQTSSQADSGAPASAQTDTDNFSPVEDVASYGFEIGNVFGLNAGKDQLCNTHFQYKPHFEHVLQGFFTEDIRL